MPAKRKGSAQRSAPKQFRCTGYGECSMVFTRSEHLARHERKHTGEKPYKCVVETCGRMFSRFDNMMQHTQTHEKKKSCSPVESDDQAKPKKARAALTGDPVTKSPIEIQEEAFPWFQVDDYSVSPLECSPMLFNRTLPPPYKQKKSSYPGQFAFYPHQYQNSMPQLPVGDSFYNSQNHFLPPVGEMFFQRPYNTHRKRASCPDRKIEYETISSLRRLSGSTASSDSGHINSPQTVMKDFNIKRRISVDALQTPIENLKAIQLDEKPIEKDSVDITQDEYEVLEAFGRFHSSPVTTPQKNFELNSEVCSIKQRVQASKLSFSRPVSQSYFG